jgi:hypothetical protein
MSRADTEGALRARDQDLATCEISRRQLFDAWPR